MTASSSGLRAPAWQVWTAVAVGGFLGTEARYLLGLFLPDAPGGFPWTTLSINAAGSFALGWFTGRWASAHQGKLWLRAGLGPGLLGSFTTFSAVSLAAVLEPDLLLPYLAASLLLGLSAAAAGLAAGQGRTR